MMEEGRWRRTDECVCEMCEDGERSEDEAKERGGGRRMETHRRVCVCVCVMCEDGERSEEEAKERGGGRRMYTGREREGRKDERGREGGRERRSVCIQFGKKKIRFLILSS